VLVVADTFRRAFTSSRRVDVTLKLASMLSAQKISPSLLASKGLSQSPCCTAPIQAACILHDMMTAAQTHAIRDTGSTRGNRFYPFAQPCSTESRRHRLAENQTEPNTVQMLKLNDRENGNYKFVLRGTHRGISLTSSKRLGRRR
jgi:hypothetical protein